MAWYTRKSFSTDAEQGISAEIQVPADAVLFDGHFPGQPILPGVAQIALVVELLAAGLKRPVAPQSISRVRFKKMIRPADTIVVRITPKGSENATYGFSLTHDQERVCSGTLTLAKSH